jgi:hypothetical protein
VSLGIDLGTDTVTDQTHLSGDLDMLTAPPDCRPFSTKPSAA